MDEQERRDTIRQAYAFRCGYCGVHEEEAGGLLEIDHFQPRVAGGEDDFDNLVYCCPTCNRLKGDFWPATNPDTTLHRVLHPQRDAVMDHFREDEEGQLVALTETGAFHIARLRLNRAPLVALRRARREHERIRQELVISQNEQLRLRESIIDLERELNEILRLLGRVLHEEQ